MNPYPLELRQRIVDAVDGQVGTIEEIAEMFSVTERYVYNLLAQRRQTGDLSPRPRGGGARAKLDGPRLLKLADLVAAQSEATLAELSQKLNRGRCQRVSLSTICRGLQKLKLTRKKKSPGGRAKLMPKNEPRFGANKRSCPRRGSG